MLVPQSLSTWVGVERAAEVCEPTGELTLDKRAELKALRRQVAELDQGQCVPGESSGLLRNQATTEKRYDLMAVHKAHVKVTCMA